jgi:hypothetical protein
MPSNALIPSSCYAEERYMSSGAERERDGDVRRIDEAIDLLLESMRCALPKTDDPVLDELNASVYAKRRADLAKSLPALFERRSKLLGLDAPTSTKAPESGAGGQDGPIVAAIRDEAGRSLRAVPK